MREDDRLMLEYDAASQARHLVQDRNEAALASIAINGAPWASLVAYADLRDGSPVICVSTLAEHGRNLSRNNRASLLIAGDAPGDDPLATPRVTLAGHVFRPTGSLGEAARIAYMLKVPNAEAYLGFGDFTVYVLKVEAVRWVGGYGKMDTITPIDYAEAPLTEL